jgi:hypothetical protein
MIAKPWQFGFALLLMIQLMDGRLDARCVDEILIVG